MERCVKLINGKFVPKGYEYKNYEIRNHGYYPPDKKVWREAIDKNTGCADFHAHTKKQLIQFIDDSNH